MKWTSGFREYIDVRNEKTPQFSNHTERVSYLVLSKGPAPPLVKVHRLVNGASAEYISFGPELLG